ncbi:hypothetical protein FA048_19405 [Pedobacter polaris]|uniref:Outer membrane protein beta-barrel domain-containing protein n=1 Tax=Pedobacter polaris TaxID=2571273 RepID=A0A4U1CIQ3_9SPHI|nr:DUF6588 family protein [Pedobacter polaris]TKC04630.1 hypothetical protein FA048_19405 [Pedobacter polaris]
MKKLSILVKTCMVLGTLVLPLNLLAQNDVGDLFKSGPADATKLVDAYMSPLFKGLGVGLNSGWNNTAKTKNLLRFELRITATAAFVPSKDQTYDVKTLGLQNISPVNPSLSTGPTAFGDDAEGARMQINGAPASSQFNLPQGSGLNFVPSPQIQLTVGLPKNIDVSLRYVPEIKLGDDFGKIGMFGIGAKVELLPLIMGKKDKLVPFDLAIALGITRLNYSLPLDINNGKYSDQEVDLKINGFNTEAIISKKILFFTPFASVGYNSSNSRLRALGTYDFDVPVTPSTPTGKQSYTDPVNLKNNEVSGLKASLGFQVNLAFLRVYGSYTQAEYGFFNAGIGFGIGK